MVEALPSLGEIDFTSKAVVAAFAGTKPTLGYGVTIASIANGVKVGLTTPPTGSMQGQMITSPVKIVLVPVAEDTGLTFETDKAWQDKIQTFTVKTGNFEVSGGLTAMQKKFPVVGTIKILRAVNYVTAFLNLSVASKASQKMSDAVTGTIQADAIVLPQVVAGSLIENPHPPLKAEGKLSEQDLSLEFKSLPTNVSDGFQGQGYLTAVLAK